MKILYDLIYRYFRAPWDIGPRSKLVELIESGEIQPCRAIDLGSGTASNAVYLAQHGFDVTGIDFSRPAIEKGKKKAADRGVNVTFFQDDLTNLSQDYGKYDFLVDYGTFDDLTLTGREKYIRNILPLTKKGSKFLIFVFEWPLRWWEKWKSFHFAMEPGEIEEYFGSSFSISNITGCATTNFKRFPAGYAIYMMTRL